MERRRPWGRRWGDVWSVNSRRVLRRLIEVAGGNRARGRSVRGVWAGSRGLGHMWSILRATTGHSAPREQLVGGGVAGATLLGMVGCPAKVSRVVEVVPQGS